MPKSLYEEAIAEAKELKSVAEQNAKNAIIEAITPKIRNFIEDQLLSSDNETIDENQDFLSETVSELVQTDEESVELDESAMIALIEMLGGSEASDALKNQGTKEELEGAILNTLSEMNDSDRDKLVKIAEEINKNVNNLESMDISIDDSQKVENKIMPDNDDVLYEVDLNDLAEMVGDEMEEEEIIDLGEVDDMDNNDADEEYMMSLDELINEAVIAVEIGDAEIDPDEIKAYLQPEDDEDLEGDEDLDMEDDEELVLDDEDEMESDEEEMDDDLEEMYEIDESVLRKELARLRTMSEGDASKMASHFGGGSATKDPLAMTDADMNVLKELRNVKRSLKKKSRTNRALGEKLNEYRSAVKTLREQLTDLNLFNAKLLYVNKLLQNSDVNASQKKTIIQSLDNAKSLREVKLLYRSLTESINESKSAKLSESKVRKALGSSSRTTGRSSSHPDAGAEMDRWATLAGLK